ncbi:MAG: hypothetical protein ACOY90_01505 [Candidatus Zhuqueibacterota bacterium]
MKRQWYLSYLMMLFTVALFSVTAHSQTSVTVSQQMSYYSNSFYNYKQLPDLNDNVGLSLSHVIEGEKVQSQLYYQGDLNVFKKYLDRFYHTQSLGYDGIAASSNHRTTYFFGGNWYWHDGRDDYDVFDYFKIQAYVNAKFYMYHNLIGRVGYVINNRSYSNLPEFNYWEHLVYFQMNTFFQTGTSITMSVNYGLKDYIPLQSMQGRGRNLVVDYSRMPAVDQLVSNVKLAQSLGMKTSISFNYVNRFKPGLVSGSATVMDSEDLFTEDELFDDRYGYSGHEVSLSFTHFLPAYIKWEIGSYYYWKNYHSRQIYDLEGNLDVSGDLRKDQRALFWSGLSRSFAINWGVKNIGLSLEGGYLVNESNASYYQFDNYFIMAGMQFKIK